MMVVTEYLPLVMATLFGFLIGWERERSGHYAGLRTNALVSLGAAAFVLLSLNLTRDYSGTDSSRVLAQIASGLGFLGAGVILKDGMKVHGLTTAATVWVSGAVGSACGAGQYGQALVVSALVVGINLMKKRHD